MGASDWLSLVLICTLGATSPGPSLAVVLAISKLHGRRGGCVAAIGHGLGVSFYALMAAASLSYILKQHASLFQAMQIAGALMLFGSGAAVNGNAPPSARPAASGTKPCAVLALATALLLPF